MKTAVPALAAAALLMLLAGCASTPAPVTEPEPEGSFWIEAGEPGPRFDYQLGGGYKPEPSVKLVVRDRTDKPAEGVDTVCYVNGFQSQPGESAFWLEEHPELILRDADGDPVIDENWPDEMLFDTSSAAQRDALVDVIGPWIDGCADDGFSGVEFDNLDSFVRSDGALSDTDNFAMATALVERVHANRLEAGQKNAAEFAEYGATVIGFDFAITEECHRWDECRAYTDVYGDDVYNIEYFGDLRGTKAEVCQDDFENRPVNTIFRDRDLVTPDDPAYRLEYC